MNYEIITDSKLKAQFEGEITYQIYPNHNMWQSIKDVSFQGLKLNIIQPNVSKSERVYITLNRGAYGRRKYTHAYIPNQYGIDLDIIPTSQQNFINDMNASNLKEAMETYIDFMKKVPFCHFIDYSASCKLNFDSNGNGLKDAKYGIHTILNIISDNYIQNYGTYNHGSDIEMIKDEMNGKMEIVFEYLNKNGLNLTYYGYGKMNTGLNYIDTAMNKVTQGFYTSNGLLGHFKNDADWLKFDLSEYLNIPIQNRLCNKNKKVYIPKTQANGKPFVPHPTSSTELSNLNDNFFEDVFDFFKKYRYKTEIMDEIRYVFRSLLYDHNSCFPVCCSALGLSRKSKKILWYILNKSYKSDGTRSLDFSSLKNFEMYLQTLQQNKAQMKYKNYFKEVIDIMNKYQKQNFQKCDLLNNRYNKVIQYDKYIAEKENEIFEIFDNNKRTVISGRAGGGKSHMLMDYAVKNLDEKKMKFILIVITKNSNLIQIKEILSYRFPHLKDRIYENFGLKKWWNPFVENHPDGCIILSSTYKMGDLKNIDLVIFDEIHNAVSFSEKIRSNVCDAKKFIYSSATPESYLIFEKDYYYLKMVKQNDQKQHIKLIKTNDMTSEMEAIIDKKEKVVIYWNNLKESELWLKDYYQRTGIKYKLMSSENVKDDEELKDMIKSETLLYNKLIVTSFYSDGINFKNNNWDVVVFRDSRHETPQNIYQTLNRLRIANPVLYVLTEQRPLSEAKWGINYDIMKNKHVKRDELQKLEKELKYLNVNIINNMINPDIIDDHLYQKNENGTYAIAFDRLKLKYFKKFFLLAYFIYENVRMDALSYYFNVFEDNNQTNQSVNINTFDPARELWMREPKKIIKMLNIDQNQFDNKLFLVDVLKNDDELIFYENINYFKIIYNKIKQLSKIQLDPEEFVKELKMDSGDWNNFISRKGREYIGSMDIDSSTHLSSYDRLNYCLFIDLHNYIIRNELFKTDKKYKDKYYYFKPEDVMNHIKKNSNDYEMFKIGDKYSFNLFCKKSPTELNMVSFNRFVSAGKNFFKPIKKKINQKTSDTRIQLKNNNHVLKMTF